MWKQVEFELHSRERGFHLVTAEVIKHLPPLPQVGLLHLFMKHTSAGLAINENSDPDVRADRFVQRWQALQAKRHDLDGWSDREARGKVEEQMRAMAKGLERDAPVEAVLRNRVHELGISPTRQDQNIAREMERHLSQGLSRSLGLER